MPSRIQHLRSRAFTRQGGTCCYCGVRMWLESPEELPPAARTPSVIRSVQCTAEHLQAKSQCGRDAAGNIAAACARCNHTRHRMRPAPDPEKYLDTVRRQVAHGGWHTKVVRRTGLLTSVSSP